MTKKIQCNLCKKSKLPEEFYINSKNKTGRQSNCIECQKLENGVPEYYPELDGELVSKINSFWKTTSC